MTEEKKYYTPDIEEFYLGFEFEFLERPGKWVKNVFEPHDWIELDGYMFLDEWIENKQVRVKYLDKEDIMELGWGFNYDTEGGLHFYQKEAEGKEGCYTMYHVPIQNRLEITEGNNSRVYPEDAYTIFDGFIYNKSELSWLMKRLGIL